MNPKTIPQLTSALALILILAQSSAPLNAQIAKVAPRIEKPLHKFLPIEDRSGVSFAYLWLDIAEEATARNVDAYGARPTIVARTLAVWATAMYDAWAAYDEKAVGSRLGGRLRRPKAEQTLANKKEAISIASYRALIFVYPESKDWLAEQLKKTGYDPDNTSTDPSTAAGIGNIAAQAVINYRKNDGANQMGEEIGGTGQPNSDYTFYQPVNSPDRIIDPDRWQPITFTMADGKKNHARLFDSALVSCEAVRVGIEQTISARSSAEDHHRRCLASKRDGTGAGLQSKTFQRTKSGGRIHARRPPFDGAERTLVAIRAGCFPAR